jgi:uncharacterized repeat protein (TIGR01451 family)
VLPTPDRLPGSRARRGRLAVTLVLTALTAGVLAVAPPPAVAAANGSLLLDDSFTGTSVANPEVLRLNAACLTAATSAPPAGASDLGECGKRSLSPSTSVTPGFLQLTDASATSTGGVVSTLPLPADGGVVVTFDQYQYGGSGADGIGFFLTDGAVALGATGAPGGSLGYAQRNSEKGVPGGYLGVGLDAYGNFSNDAEGRGAGCGPTSAWGPTAPSGVASTRTADAVVLRGPGNDLTGYCYLAGRKMTTSLRSADKPTTEAGIEALARTVRITVSESVEPLVTVAIDDDGRGGPHGMVDVLSYQMTTPAPATYKFGFLGSTGGSTDVHLVRNLTVTSAVQLADLHLTKQVDRTTGTVPASYPPGATVPYQYVVTNTRDVPMTGVAVSDPAGPVTCPRTGLGRSGSATARMVCAGSHLLTATDFDGSTAYGTAATAAATVAGTPVASNASTATVPLAVHAAVTASVTATLPDGGTVAEAGTVVTYDHGVRNSGNTPLSALSLTATRNGSPSCPATTVAAGGSLVCTATYTVTQADVDAGAVPNAVIATATGALAGGGTGPVTSPRATVSTPVPAAAPALAVTTATAAVAGGGTSADTGERVTYTYGLQNTGNVTLTAVGLAVTGDVDPTWVRCTPATLAPGASAACTAAHDVTSADVLAEDDLSVTGTGSGTPPVASGTAPATSDPREVTMPVAGVDRALGLTGVREFADTDGDGRVGVGRQVTYRWTVSNAGNVDLPAPAITAPGATAISCASTAVLPVGGTRACSGVHTVTQDDVDAGTSLVNRAVAAAGTGSARVASSVVELAIELPAVVSGLHVAPVALLDDTDSDGRADVGERVRVTYTVTNTGTQTVRGVGVGDPLAGEDGIDCPSSGPLAPAAQRACTYTHEVTQDDVDAGRVRFVGTSTALTPGGDPVTSAPTAVEVGAEDPVARIGLALQAGIRGGGAAARVRDVVDYAFTVGNEGNVTLHAVDLAVTGVVSSVSCPQDGLAPGRSMRCTADYGVVQRDIDDQVRLAVQGVATGELPVPAAVPPAPGPHAGAPPVAAARQVAAALPAMVTSAMVSAVEAVVPAVPDAELTTAEATFPDLDGDGRAVLEELVTYRFVVVNSGNTTLRDVAVGVTGFAEPVTCTPATLLPGETASCSAAREVAAEDLARGGSLLADVRPLASAPAGVFDPVTRQVSTALATAPAPAPVPAPVPAGPAVEPAPVSVSAVAPEPGGAPEPAAAPEAAGLASTGATPGWPLVFASGMLAAGLAVLLAARRRRAAG